MFPGALRSSARLGHFWCHPPGLRPAGCFCLSRCAQPHRPNAPPPLKQRCAIACNGLRVRGLWEPLSLIALRLLQWRRHRGRQACPWRVITGLEVEPAALFGLQQQSGGCLHPEEGSSECVADLHGMKIFASNRAEVTLLGSNACWKWPCTGVNAVSRADANPVIGFNQSGMGIWSLGYCTRAARVR